MKRAASVFLAAGLALAGMPVGAQDLPNSIKGSVPAGIDGVANALLEDMSGKDVATVAVTEGKFAFRNVAPGDYYVGLYSTLGQRIVRSCSVALASGATREASFDCPAPAAVPPPAATPAATTAHGIGRTGWIVIGAAAVGITTAVVVVTNNDEGVASPAR